jgi:hypothetical protein
MEVKDEQVGGEEAGGQVSMNGNDGVPWRCIYRRCRRGGGGGLLQQEFDDEIHSAAKLEQMSAGKVLAGSSRQGVKGAKKRRGADGRRGAIFC